MLLKPVGGDTMEIIDRMKCLVGLHQWGIPIMHHSPLENVTGHDILDTIEDDLVVCTTTRYCDRCSKIHIKHQLLW